MTFSVSIAMSFSVAPLYAADRVGSPDQSGMDKSYVESMKYLKSLEDRFFFHSYDHDPVEKRVERLELLIFGGHQYGVPEERLDKLKQTIQERDKESARAHAKRAEEKSSAKSGSNSDTESGSLTQYPVLNTLEWRVLKKTYGKESIDERLGRLEKALFGQESPAMSYADRIDRLKKIAGVNITSLNGNDPQIVPGPLPQAGATPYRLPSLPPSMPNFDPNSQSFQNDLRKQFMKDIPNMFKYMDGDLKKFFEGYQMSPQGKSPYMVPQKKPSVTIPPYADPNSI